jgi:hypothetical protein
MRHAASAMAEKCRVISLMPGRIALTDGRTDEARMKLA